MESLLVSSFVKSLREWSIRVIGRVLLRLLSYLSFFGMAHIFAANHCFGTCSKRRQALNSCKRMSKEGAGMCWINSFDMPFGPVALFLGASLITVVSSSKVNGARSGSYVVGCMFFWGA